ncbi:hypothetical protein NS303_04495 [Pantoea ananatis]|uniref:DUF2213 domain-containing protein n=1 Tax=Pantoea ananas TaxID=553 RepID=UPI0007375257|nr:DUF2213 domain-containing protein [Pantoea ananatis]KTR49336.1 hypothetical protein NS303_04495 [Pantoea ananatis]KTR65479.1 hypothetical protein RSA47_05405 [Pantoea ananatis]KTR69770.1 hypothetical protein NS296_13940 [Pantoea ananatis]
MKYFFNTRLGPNRYLLGDGSLLCKDVPIARLGDQAYRSEDLPELTPDDDGEIIVTRSADEVFSPEAMASFEGMTVVILHPEDEAGDILFVDPANWRQLAIGHAANVRRGQGDQSDLLIADLVIKDALGIQAINDGLRQVSCGYNAEYDETAPGRANQYDIRGNHIALVPNGRAGIRCSIGDAISMASKAKQWFASLRKAVKTRDSAAAEELLNNAPDNMVGDDDDDDDGVTTVVVKVEGPETAVPPVSPTNAVADESSDLETRITAIEAAVKVLTDKMAPPTGDADDDEKKEEKKMTGDAGYQQDVFSRAELILPGFSLPEGSKMGTLKREVLGAALRTADGLKLIEPLSGKNPDFAKMSMATVDSIFNGASELAKSRNNSGLSLAVFTANSQSGDVAALNEKNKDFWAKKGAK